MRALTAAGVALVAMLAPGAASAAGGLPPGVHVDPGSPSAHQYAIPISAARAETGGGGGSGGGGSQLFGAGITAGSGGSGGGSSGAGASSYGHRWDTAGGAGGTAGPYGDGVQGSGVRGSYALASQTGLSPASAQSSGADGGSSWVPLVGGGALVLLLGGAGGLAIRRQILRT